MKSNNLKQLNSKEIIVFDLDGTLIETKSPMDKGMTRLVMKLLAVKTVAVIGGGKYSIFHELFLNKLKNSPKLLKKLFIFPTTATAFYKYTTKWIKVYSLLLRQQEINKIKKTFLEVFKELNYQHPKKTYGPIIENRGTQVSFSVYGQDLVKVLGKKGVKMKENWLKNNLKIKMQIAKLIAKKLPEFEVLAAGFNTKDLPRLVSDNA